jgi:hypothetical protein
MGIGVLVIGAAWVQAWSAASTTDGHISTNKETVKRLDEKIDGVSEQLRRIEDILREPKDK